MAAILKKNLQILKFTSAKFGFCLRWFSSPPGQNVQNYSVIPLWSNRVKNFGNLRVFNGNISLHVVGSNSWHGEQSRVAVSLYSDSEDVLALKDTLRECVRCDVTTNDDELSHVTIQSDASKIQQNFKSTSLDTSKLLIEIPHSYGLFLSSSSQSPVTVENLEGDKIEIETEGNCYLSQLRSQSITVSSVSGDILCKSLVGDVALTCNKDGCVSLGKVQGNDIKIRCENGDVRIDSLYGGEVLINTCLGSVAIGDAHGNIEVTSSSGDIKCGSISGLLKAVTHDGDIEAKLTSGGNVTATSLNGNATIKLSADLKCKLELSSQTMDIASELHIFEKSEEIADDLIKLTGQTSGTGEQYARVKCHQGNINLLQESWFVMPKS